MSTTAFSSAFAIGVFAADELYYDLNVSYPLAIFTMIGSQFLGYGIAGLMRSVVVFPSYALWPNVLPTVQLMQLLHKDHDFVGQRKRLKVFGAVFVGVFVWEWFPEFIAPTLTGVSVFWYVRASYIAHVWSHSISLTLNLWQFSLTQPRQA